jgi:hypothetical protein
MIRNWFLNHGFNDSKLKKEREYMSEFDRLSDRFDNLEKKVEQSGDNVLDFMIRASDRQERPQKHDKVLAAAKHRIHNLESELEACHSAKNKAEALAERVIGAYDKLSQVTEKVVEKAVVSPVIIPKVQNKSIKISRHIGVAPKEEKESSSYADIHKIISTELSGLKVLNPKFSLERLNGIISAEIEKGVQCIKSSKAPVLLGNLPQFAYSPDKDLGYKTVFYNFLSNVTATGTLTNSEDFLARNIDKTYHRLNEEYKELSKENYNKLIATPGETHYAGGLVESNANRVTAKALERYYGRDQLGWSETSSYSMLVPYSRFTQTQQYIKCQIDFIDFLRDLKSNVGLGLKTNKKKSKRKNTRKKNTRKKNTRKKNTRKKNTRKKKQNLIEERTLVS